MPDHTLGPPAPSLWTRRRRLRLSLRGLMVLVLIFGGGLGWIVLRTKVQRDAVLAITRTGGSVVYDWDIWPNRWFSPTRAPKALKWLVDWLGPDYLGNVVRVWLGPSAGDAEMAHVVRLPRLISFSDLGATITDAHAVDLGNLLELQSVDFSGRSRVTGATFARLAGLPKLHTLHAGGLEVGDADLLAFAGWPRLNNLDLSSTRITDAGLAHLRGMGGLLSLGLDDTAITGAGLENLGPMPQLLEIRLSRTRVADLTPLVGLAKLRRLDLSQTPITDSGLAPIVKLAGLRTLIIENSRITQAGLIPLQNLKNLTVLDLSGSWITDSGAEALAKVPNLTELYLPNSAITDAGVAQLRQIKNLIDLDLIGSAITDAALAHFLGMNQLRNLHLGGTNVSLGGAAMLRRTYPHLDVIR